MCSSARTVRADCSEQSGRVSASCDDVWHSYARFCALAGVHLRPPLPPRVFAAIRQGSVLRGFGAHGRDGDVPDEEVRFLRFIVPAEWVVLLGGWRTMKYVSGIGTIPSTPTGRYACDPSVHVSWCFRLRSLDSRLAPRPLCSRWTRQRCDRASRMQWKRKASGLQVGSQASPPNPPRRIQPNQRAADTSGARGTDCLVGEREAPRIPDHQRSFFELAVRSSAVVR